MENKVRQVVVYKDFFQSFFAQQDRKVQDKIIKILDIIEQLERIPESYLKYLSETDGLYEIRVQLGKEFSGFFASSMEKESSFCSVAFRRRHGKRLPAKLGKRRD